MIDAGTLKDLPDALKARLQARGFDGGQLLEWAGRVGEGDERNRLTGEVELVPESELERLPRDEQERAALRARGERALASGELAICVLAGGMATRMGGVVKSLVPVHEERTFLDLRLAERTKIARDHGKAPPMWLMTSEPTDPPINEALAARGLREDEDVATFEQFVSLRLTPSGDLFRDAEGTPSVYATGHGDLPDALRKSGLIERFVDNGGRYVWISNVDNLGASVDPAILGQHIVEDRRLTVDVVEKDPGDKGGGPVLLDGEPIIAEHFRLPKSFDPDRIGVFNTNTFLVDAQRLLELDMDWTYVEVSKSVGDAEAVQFERLLGEITVAIRPSFQHVPRRGKRSRFLPVKTHEDLEAAKVAIGEIAARLDAD
jgi:UTP--glucose-1-phosphate uridylyltransferase